MNATNLTLWTQRIAYKGTYLEEKKGKKKSRIRERDKRKKHVD